MAQPAPTQPHLDPVYSRRALHPTEGAFHQRVAKACGDGDLANITKIVENSLCCQECMTDGLEAAIRSNRVEVTAFLLEKSSTIEQGAILTALRAKSLTIFRLLLKHGWDINAPYDDSKRSAIIFVLEDEGLVKWFLENGAKVDSVSQSSRDPSILDLAASGASTAVYDLLLKRGASHVKRIPLHAAAGSGRDGRIPMMAYLIEAGYDINAFDTNVQPWMRRVGTPLQYAIRAQSLPNVEFLVRHGADPHKPGGLSGSAYTMAERMGLKEILRVLQRSDSEK
ncbi:MAG: hypothetical protein Q9221_008595 [Calogaya cf. arnoldii]